MTAVLEKPHAPSTHYDDTGAPSSVVTTSWAQKDPRLKLSPAPMPPRTQPVGNQLPRYFHAPVWTRTAYDDAVDLAAAVGIQLLPWQAMCLRNIMAERPNGKWAAFEVGLVLPRQNGKNVLILVRQLAGLFLFGEDLQVHTAHKFKTAKAHHRALVRLIESVPELDELVSVTTSTENLSIVRKDTGARIDFLARKGGSGRGLTGDTVYLDEAFALADEVVSDLLPTLSSRPAPQVWYTSSAGMEDSEFLPRLQERAVKHPEQESTLFYAEWSADLDQYNRDTPEAVQQSNPSLGWFQDWEWIEGAELRTMGAEQYDRERLGVWASNETAAVIGKVWKYGAIIPDDIAGIAVVRRSLAVEVTADRDMAVLAGAAELEDGRVVVDILDQKAGTAWIAETCKYRNKANPAWAGVIIDAQSGAAAVAPHIIAAGVPVTMAQTRDLTTGTADFYDRVTRKDPDSNVYVPEILHAADGSGFLDDAAYTARKRLVGQSKTAWTWDQGALEVPLEPLRAVTLALKGLDMEPVKRKRRRVA